MPMAMWKTAVAMSRATTVISAWLLCVLCGPPEQGYWTKQGFPSLRQTSEYLPRYAIFRVKCDRHAGRRHVHDAAFYWGIWLDEADWKSSEALKPSTECR